MSIQRKLFEPEKKTSYILPLSQLDAIYVTLGKDPQCNDTNTYFFLVGPSLRMLQDFYTDQYYPSM